MEIRRRARHRFGPPGSSSLIRPCSGRQIATAGAPSSSPAPRTPVSVPYAVRTVAVSPSTPATSPGTSLAIPTKLATYRVAGRS